MRPCSLVDEYNIVAGTHWVYLQNCVFFRKFGTTVLIAQCHNPEEHNIYLHYCRNLAPYSYHIKPSQHLREYTAAVHCRLCSDKGVLFYLTTRITTSPRPPHMITRNAVLATIPLCPKSGSTNFSSIIAVNMRFMLCIFKDSAVNVFLQLAAVCHI
jgi:hypothetical protein